MIKQYNILPTTSKQVINEPICLCIGSFATLHTGHADLIAQAKAYAQEQKVALAVLTFNPLPYEFISKQSLPLITEPNQRFNLFKQWGVNHWVVLQFNALLRSFSVDKFHDLLHECFNIKAIFASTDFVYGFNRTGNIKTLQNSFQTKIVPLTTFHERKIGTTMIANKLAKGEMSTVNQLLNRPYQISGIVKRNFGVGSTLNFPTANIELLYNMLVPKPGIYAGQVVLSVTKQVKLAALYIGTAPTFSKELNKFRIEAHILDFDKTIYNETIRLQFCYYLREDYTFKSVTLLKGQMERDVKCIRKIMPKLIKIE